MTHPRPTVRTLTYSNGAWTAGAEVPRPRPWRRWIANAAAVLWLGFIALVTMGVAAAIVAWELLFRLLLGGIGDGVTW